MGWISDLAGSLCCVLGQNTLLSKCSSALGVEMGIGELSGKSDEMAGVALQWTAFLSRERWGGGGEVIVLLVSSFYENQDKLELDGPLGLGVDFTLPLPKGFRR